MTIANTCSSATDHDATRLLAIGLSGTGSSVHRVADNARTIESAVATIDVGAPQSHDIDVAEFTMYAGESVQGSLLENEQDSSVVRLFGDPPSNGTVRINPDGTFEYTPDDGFAGSDSFQYSIDDECGCCEIAELYVIVRTKANEEHIQAREKSESRGAATTENVAS